MQSNTASLESLVSVGKNTEWLQICWWFRKRQIFYWQKIQKTCLPQNSLPIFKFYPPRHKLILNPEYRMLWWHSTRTQAQRESLTRRLFCEKLVLHMYYCNAIISVSCHSYKNYKLTHARDKIQYLETALQEKTFLYVFRIENYKSSKLSDNLVPLCSM